MEQLRRTLREEGGIADRPASEDPGGLTNKGITQKLLNQYRLRHPGEPFPASVLDLNPFEVAKLYRRVFWEPCKCDLLPPALAVVTFDMAVMSGQYVAGFLVQEALNGGISVDGWIGPETVRRAQAAFAAGGLARLCLLEKNREDWLKRRKNFRANPGWIPRTQRNFGFARQLLA